MREDEERDVRSYRMASRGKKIDTGNRRSTRSYCV